MAEKIMKKQIPNPNSISYFPGSKSVNIKGRVTWEETGLEEKSHPDRMNIVISSTLK